MDRNGSIQTHKSTKGHTLTRSLAVVGDDDGISSQKDGAESAVQDDLLPFIKETLNKNVKDRNLILRTEAELLQFINSQSQMLPLPGPYSSYQRLLIHRVAAYFQLEHNIDNSGSGIIISRGDRPLPEGGSRVKFRDLILTNLSHEEAQKRQRKHSRNQTPPQWSLAPQQRILKVASFDEGRAQPAPHVAKAFSFGGYPRHHNSNTQHKTPNTLSKLTIYSPPPHHQGQVDFEHGAEASLSPASSGYKSTSFPSMELRTPSPAGPYFPTADEIATGGPPPQAIPPPQATHIPPAASITPTNPSQPQELVLWAVSDIKSVPPGALLIDPTTLSPIRYAGQDEGIPMYPQGIPPQAYYQPPPPLQMPHHAPPQTYNYYEHVGDLSHWLAGISLNSAQAQQSQQQQYYQHSQPLQPHTHAQQQHPGLCYPPPISYYPQPSRIPHGASGMTGHPIRFYFPQSPLVPSTNPPFLLQMPPTLQQFPPKSFTPQDYTQGSPAQTQSLPLQPLSYPSHTRWSSLDGGGYVQRQFQPRQSKHNNRQN